MEVARAARDAGLAGLVGVELARRGNDLRAVRLVGGNDHDALVAANRALRSEPGHAAGLSFSLADPGIFRIDPSNTTGTETTYDYARDWGCIDQTTNGVWQPTAVIINSFHQQPVENTGGHVSEGSAHSIGAKPLGDWSAATGVTEDDGLWESTYTAPEVAGEEEIDYTVTGISRCTGTTTVQERYSVALPGLRPIVNGTFGISVPDPTSKHTSVGYATPGVIPKVYATHQAYFGRYQDRVVVTAASTPEGGLNDVKNNWAPPHSEHRSGQEVDMVGKYVKQKVNSKIAQVPDLIALQRIAAIGNQNQLLCSVEVMRRGVTLSRDQWHVHCNDI
ncbi:MAG: hypothetical protein ACJ8DC_07915 [Gemmatimonadales bacterium]